MISLAELTAEKKMLESAVAQRHGQKVTLTWEKAAEIIKDSPIIRHRIVRDGFLHYAVVDYINAKWAHEREAFWRYFREQGVNRAVMCVGVKYGNQCG